VYFSDAIIIMTSNLGAEELSKLTRPLGFGPGSEEFEPVRKAVLRAAENRFSPEFINRLDDIVVFAPLSFPEVRRIAELYLDSIRRMMEAHKKTLTVSAAALSALAQTGFSVKYGARFLKRTIDEKVKMPVTLQWRAGDHFLVEEVGGELAVITQAVPV
jgi:ATP-dependent Clp protease ATP-binding subunit ClpA